MEYAQVAFLSIRRDFLSKNGLDRRENAVFVKKNVRNACHIQKKQYLCNRIQEMHDVL